jgi:hypothetical protein
MFDELLEHNAHRVDQIVEDNHDAVTLVVGDSPAVPGSFGFCIVYVSGRPVLQWVRAMLFFKPKWRAVLTAMIAGLDAMCAEAPKTEAAAAPAELSVAAPIIGNGGAIDKKDESVAE